MGLFQKKKAAIERAKIEQTHEIVCLYCFRNFDHNQVLFRASQGKGADGYLAEIDYTLDEYRALFRMGAIGELPPALIPSGFSERNKGYLRGILSSLRDDHNNLTTKRLCPHCHNDIMPSAGFSPCTVISIIGAGKAGKSVYLTSLIHTLRTATSLNFDIFCTPITSEMGRKFKYKYEDPLVEKGCLPESTQKSRPHEPLVFTISFADETKPEINLAFFDVESDGMIDTAHTDIFSAKIRNSSAILFLVDPQQFHSIGRKVQIISGLDYSLTAITEPTEVLGSLLENHIHKHHGGTSHIPTAVVLTKTDLLEALSYEGDYIRPKSSVFTRYIHRRYLNLTEAEIIHNDVDEFIQRVDPNFRIALKRRFANLGFFAVSALGTHPDVVRQRPASYSPMRVDEPFLWLLYKLGYIDGFDEGVRL